MPGYNGSGTYQRFRSWEADAAAGVKIRADYHDDEDDGFAAGLSNAICRDGQSTITANIPFNAKKITNLAAGTDPTDAINLGQLTAFKDFPTGINLPGAGVNNRLSWTIGDMSFFVRSIGDPAGTTTPRFVWNDKADGTGTDIATMNDTGQLALGMAIPATSTQKLFLNGDLTLGKSGSTTIGFNAHLDVSGAPKWVATVAGWGGYMSFNSTNGQLGIVCSNATAAAGAALQGLANQLLVSYDDVTVSVLLKGTANVISEKTGATQPSVGCHAPARATCYGMWNATNNTLAFGSMDGVGAPSTTWASMSASSFVVNNGNITAGGGAFISVVASAVLAATGAGNVYLRPNGSGSNAGEVRVDTTGRIHTGVAGCMYGSNLGFHAGGNTFYLSFQSTSWGFSHNSVDGSFHAMRAAATWTLWRASDGALIHYVGNAYKPGGGVWADSSDARIKNVLGDYESGLDAINALRPVRYTFKGNDTDAPPKDKPDYMPEYTNTITPAPPLDEIESLEAEAAMRRSGEAATVPYWNSPHHDAASKNVEYVGLIAQEVEQVMPGMVTQRTAYIDGEEVTDLRDLDTAPLIFALINAVKELSAKVAALEAA